MSIDCRIGRQDSALFVVEHKGELVARTEVLLHATVSHIRSVYVAPKVRKRCLAKTLLLRAMVRAGAYGSESVRLDVDINNKRAIQIYRRAGFIVARDDGNGNIQMACKL